MKTFSLQPEQPQQPTDLLKGLNPQQHEAVATTNGPLLIVAGAGSGKTRVLTIRIAYLLQQFKAAPNEILALTFTNKAAREMKERITKLIGDKAKKLWMGTFHSIFSKILRFEAEKLGYGTDFTIYDTSDSETVIKQILQELNLDPKEIKPKTIRNKISDAKNQLIDAENYQARFVSSTLDDITARVYKVYNARLKQSNAMDFDDLLVKPIQLFEENPDLLEKYQDRFKYILIDEYQDTNHAQYKVTKMLADKYRNICVVGDDAQSIYSFRGADISNILNFKEDYENAKQVPLEQNYRSTKSILLCADSIIKKNTNQLDKTLWTQQGLGDPVILLQNYDERDEANRVAQHIQDLRMRHGYDFNKFAILYRTNYQSRVFEEAFRRHDIAYQLIGGLSFYQRKEIKDVLAYLTLLVNKHDETNLVRIINEPSRGIGNKSITDLRIQARESGRTLWNIFEQVESASVYKPAKSRIRHFVDMIERLSYELESGRSLTEVTRSLLEQSGYMKALVEENSQESMMRRENILELQNAISYYEKGSSKPSLSAFLQEISLITDGDKFDENKPAVTLMTVHGSKGLEFPVVFVVGMEENLFPVGGREGFEADLEEERRLFYVAITRAEERLFFSYCRTRFKFGEEQQQLRSRFLDEVDAGVVRTESGATISQKKDRYEQNESSAQTKNRGTHVEYDWQQPITKKTSKSSLGTIHYEFDSGEDPFVVGARVAHAKFGEGKILSRTGSGMDAKVVVFFQKRGQKKLMLRAAPLQIIDQTGRNLKTMLKQAALLVVMALCSSLIVQAQPVLTPKNVALGGGGSTYITDYNANFYNPANLFISDRIRNFDLGLAITGTYFNGVQNFSGLDEQRSNLQDYLYAYKPGLYRITESERNNIVDDNYIKNRTTSLHQTRLEGTLLGLKFRNEKRAISLAIRNRTASSFEVGRGWYSADLQESENEMVLDRTLIHRYQSMYEISIGYAESFRFFTDMTPRLDELTFGIAPKLVLAGPYQEAVWRNKYVENGDGSYSLVQDFEFRSTGSFSQALEQYRAGVPIETALTNTIANDVFDVQGYGAGIDIGLTYLITLGNDLSTISTEQRTRKSLRFSFSITDIGFVNYDESPSELTIGLDTVAANLPTNLSTESFVGAPGQFLSFVVNHGANNPFAETTLQRGSKQVLLPTAIHGGILFEINRLKLMGDLSVGLTNNAYNSKKLVASVGVELRPLPFLPLRAGTQLATELPSFFSFGTGIETKLWDISIATQFVSRTFSDNPTLSGVTVAALQFHF